MAAVCLLLTASCGERAEQASADLNAVRPPRAVAQTEPSSVKLDQPRLLLENGALVLQGPAGKTHRIAFGDPAATAVAAASKIYGDPLTSETLEECGAGPLQVSRFSGMTIASQNGKFAGWSLDGRDQPPRPTTARGIGIGSTRRALEKAHTIEIFESSLGHEFTADGLAGLLGGKGELSKITHLWAGSTCIMR